MKGCRAGMMLFTGIAILLFGSMCFVVGYEYATHLCGMRHIGWSAPPDVAFIYAVPFLLGIAVCMVIVWLFYRKYKNVGVNRHESKIASKL